MRSGTALRQPIRDNEACISDRFTIASSSSAWKKANSKSAGIIIPDSAKEKPQQGKVLAVGNGKANDEGKRFPLDVKPGNLILFGKYSGQEIKLDGEEYLIVKEDEVLAVIDNEATKKPEKNT